MSHFINSIEISIILKLRNDVNGSKIFDFLGNAEVINSATSQNLSNAEF